MTEQRYPIKESIRENAYISADDYQAMYEQSVNDPDAFWKQVSERISWHQAPSKIKNCSFDKNDLYIKWFEDGVLNASENCLDRHLSERGEKLALQWEPDEEGQASRQFTYNELHQEVCKLANGLKSLGVKKGDVVTLYMPMVPEAVFAMLACARIGAMHSVVFAGFSPEALAGRISDGQSALVITADEGRRGGKTVPLKQNVDEAIELCSPACVEKVLVLKHTGADIHWRANRDVEYHSLVEQQSPVCPPEPMNAEDPLFLLYTSGSTGKPKGAVHTTGGYMVYTSLSHHTVFDYKTDEVYWCMADIGWITGHSYAVYGPLSNGASCIMYEGVPNYPDCGRLGRIIDKYQVNTLYTAPTVIRALMAKSEEATATNSRASLRLLGTAGEPINPEAWGWFHDVFGEGRCPILDTWWQTETGGMMIAPMPGATELKPGSATQPFFGVQPALLDNDGNVLDGATDGNLVICDSWPGQMRTIFGDHQRFIDTYFSTFNGYYFSSDGARRDADGDYWITGRVDDVLNVSGHRMGTAELESALVAHPKVTEAAVVGFPHEIKGEGIYIYVSLQQGEQGDDALLQELKQWLRREIGPIASPDVIQWADDLPKTRSGKIMRRILRKIAANEYDALGDISTLADPSVVARLIEGHQHINENAA
ncbi:acetate--CoA ligase [Spongiibacter marinus]|jgi:acetyl-CoA synthetase|uniref:acetate--CoA ligase n=1 Tax=Spongiibacter marinus TaxID=354246 RepID=UPI00195F4D05|nr:acetate--CoA ligase [Spongiibacter marinus]MBM7424046.1 acetyl-CoA synthetase [Spongiibacter marinus]